MPRRKGGGGGVGGRGRGRGAAGAYDPGFPPLAPEGQRGGGGGVPLGGRDGGRGSGGTGGAGGSQTPPPTIAAAVLSDPALPPIQSAAPRRPSLADVPSSSEAASAAAALSKEIETQMTLADTAEPGAATGKEVVPDPPPASSKAVRPTSRPGFGIAGKKCLVRANHFLMEVTAKDLCHYDVVITPESASRAFNRKVIAELVRLYSNEFLGGRTPAYDGRKSFYTAGALPFESKEFCIKVPDKDPSRGERECKVTIRYVGRANIRHLRQFLSGRQIDVPQETIQILDVALRELPSNNYVSVFRSFYSPELGGKGDIGEGVEFWKGYYQSVRPTQMGLSLNIDISSTSFYKPMMVTEFVAEHLNMNEIKKPLSDIERIKIKKALRGIRVETLHNKDTYRRYKITGITSIPMSQLTFPIDEHGGSMSVIQYFLDTYGYHLEKGYLPALQAGSDSRPKYLPMEVCKIVEGQRYTKKLSSRQVSSILKSTCQRPYQRESSIWQIVQHNNYKGDKLAKEFGIQVSNELATVEARVLPPPKLKYHDSGRDKSCSPSIGQWNMINKKMVNGGNVKCWTCLSFSRLSVDVVKRFCRSLVNMCNNIGMVVDETPLLDIRATQPARLDSALRELYKQSIHIKKCIQLLIIILPEMKGSYGKIKRICETELGIVTQCCAPTKITKGDPQYLENVALKINVKVGGRNTVLEDAVNRSIPLVSDHPTIIFGADVTHPSPGDDSMSSIAAVVASMDWPEVMKYRGLVSAQHHREEMIQDLYKITEDPKRGPVHGGLIRELLISFYKATNRKPHRIIFFRDGVSEGQFNHVLLFEVDAIRKACASIQEGYMPPVTFVIVQKRHHTRIFPEIHEKRDLTDKSGNILPGTVVDKSICHPTEFDFYLCSHAGIQGTSRPSHYHVLLDENEFSADDLQTLVNKLCYTYARCTRSVSVVPPAYYAHLAAFRARYYMDDLYDEASSSTAGGGNRDAPAPVRHLPPLHDNVKDVMFYC